MSKATQPEAAPCVFCARTVSLSPECAQVPCSCRCHNGGAEGARVTRAAGPLRVYVASSWRNTVQPRVVEELRARGLDVYNYREPAPGVSGFSWSEIDPSWEAWSPRAYREALKHPIAARGYGYDINALRACDVCVLVLPSGRSASWEFGYAMGQGKRGIVVMLTDAEPELMYREAEIVTSYGELHDAIDFIEDSPGMVGRPFAMSRDPNEATR